MSQSRLATSCRALLGLAVSAAILFAARPALATPHYYSYLPQYSAVGAQIVGGGINNSATVAFQTTVGSVTTVYTAYGGHLTKIGDTTQTTPVTFRAYDDGDVRYGSALYSNIRSVGIDDSGNGYFVATLQPLNLPYFFSSYPQDRVVTGTGGPLSGVYDFTLSSAPSDAPIPRAAYSDSGIVAATNGYLNTTLISNGVSTPISSAPTYIAPYYPVVNNSGMLAGSAEANGLWVSNGSSAWTVGYFGYGGVGPDVAINNAGTILFERDDENTRQIALQMLKGGTLSSVVDFASPFQEFRSLALNDNESLAFIGYRDLVKGIYVGPDPSQDKLLRVGDSFDGSTITDLSLFKKGLNNSGDIAFVATLADGRSGVYIAEPVPEPSSLVLAVLAALGCLGVRWRHHCSARERRIQGSMSSSATGSH